MTNQAAQTMPELPVALASIHADGYWTTDDRRPDWKWPASQRVFSVDQMHQYARDYAAALSQTAGVADGWKLVPVEPTEAMCEAAMSSLGWSRSQAAAKTAPITPASPMMEGSMKVWSAMLAAAPAASGVHPDALPDGTLSKSTAKRVEALVASGGEDGWSLAMRVREALDRASCPDHFMRIAVETITGDAPQPPASASVSERARELLAGAYRVHGHFEYADILLNKPLVGEDYIAAYAIEQALTQKRGHGEAVDRDAWAEALELPEGYTVEEFLPGGWHYAWTRADGERMVSGTTWNHPALAAIAAWKYAPDTTPQPSADAVRELVLLSRGLAKRTFNRSTAEMYIHFADELESLLSGGSHA